jgi:hypothetical protein
MIDDMASPAEFLGPILELMTWVGLVPGIPLLITGWIMARRRCQWMSTTAEVFDAGRYKGFRWSDSASTPQLSLHNPAHGKGPDIGTQIELHYDQCHPARWSLRSPRHDNPTLILGWILTGVGILCMVAGFFLLMF